MRIALATLLLALGVFGQALSQDLDDDAYINNYFGTSAIIFSEKQLVDPEVQWWTDLLPGDLVYGSSYIAGLVNAFRIGKGDDRLISPEETVVTTGWEAEDVDGSGFEYTIDFAMLRPSEVELVFAALGGLNKYLGEVEVSYLPLITENYYDYNENLDPIIEVTIGSQVVAIDTSKHINDVLKQLRAVISEEYGGHTITGISIVSSIYDGYESVSLSFDVELDAG